MQYKEAKDIIKRNIDCRQYLKQSQGGFYVCPFCHSGEKGNKTGAVKYYDTNTWHCFACDKSGDAIDLYQNATGASGHDAIIELAKQAGITERIEFGTPDAADLRQNAPGAGNPSLNGRSEEKPRDTSEANPLQQPTANYNKYYIQCRQNLQESADAQAYLQRRGISLDLALKYFVGFDPQADPANAPGAMGDEYRPHPCPRIIIPTCSAHYVARSIDPKTEEIYKKMNPNKDKGAGAPDIFGWHSAFNTPGVETVFVVEGAFDALAIMETGATAVALNSTSNAGKLLKDLEAKPTAATLILCLDNDPAGRKATETLLEGLNRLNISCIKADICGTHKDPNEALTADRAAFEEAIEKAVIAAATRPDNTALYIDKLMGGEIERFKQARDTKTGFSNLDEKTGGINAGLYVLAAITSLGKTTFALQMADQMAAAGREVLFFSMEQSRLEIVSKSLARLTAQADMKTAVDSLSIRRGYLPLQVMEAKRQYLERIGERLSIIEGNFNCDIGFIAQYIRNYQQRTGATPVVFIDYLQVLQPTKTDKTKNSKKEDIDLAVIELKRLSREMNLPVFIISSLNRANYLTPFAQEALKESGNIEYTCDVLFGLQLACLDEELFDKEGQIAKKRERITEAKNENPRKIKLVCLKNRYGISSFECNFSYYSSYDLFVPEIEPAHDWKSEKPRKMTAGGKLK